VSSLDTRVLASDAAQLPCASVPPSARMHIRLSRELRDKVVRHASRLGVSQSEFAREALAAHIAWHDALDAVDEGMSTDDLRDPEMVKKVRGRKER